MSEVVKESVGVVVPVVEGQAQTIVAKRDQRGMVSAEWAVGLIAAIAVAGVLLGVVTQGPVKEALLHFILQVIQSFSGYLSGH